MTSHFNDYDPPRDPNTIKEFDRVGVCTYASLPVGAYWLSRDEAVFGFKPCQPSALPPGSPASAMAQLLAAARVWHIIPTRFQ